MCGRRLKNMPFLLAVCFLLLAGSFSAYSQGQELTEAEKAEPADLSKGELQEIFLKLDNSEKQNENWQTKYNELNQTYLTALTEHKIELMTYEQKLKLMEIESQVREGALKKLESETVWTKVGLFAIGAVLGSWLDANIRDWSDYYWSIKEETAGE